MLTIIRGLPGSGKTVLARRLTDFVGGEHIESDQYFMVKGVYTFDATKLGLAHDECLARTRTALIRAKSVFVSNTFTRRWEYEPYLQLAKELKVPAQVIEVHGNFGSVHNVPDAVLDAMRGRWEPHTENPK